MKMRHPLVVFIFIMVAALLSAALIYVLAMPAEPAPMTETPYQLRLTVERMDSPDTHVTGAAPAAEESADDDLGRPQPNW